MPCYAECSLEELRYVHLTGQPLPAATALEAGATDATAECGHCARVLGASREAFRCESTGFVACAKCYASLGYPSTDVPEAAEETAPASRADALADVAAVAASEALAEETTAYRKELAWTCSAQVRPVESARDCSRLLETA